MRPDQPPRQHNPKDFYHDTIRHTSNRSLEGAVAQATEGVLQPTSLKTTLPITASFWFC